jgi:regulatory protein
MNFRYKKLYTIDEAIRLLENYCAYQERCHKEVHQKLIELKMIPETRDIIVSHLIKENYLNETRFSKVFVKSKFNQKKWGKRRLINELKNRKVSAYNIDLALKEISDEEYYKTFNSISENRFDQLQGETNSRKKMRKFIDYLNYRGWEIDMIYKKKNELFS